jgi:tripartite ATP-independent transporter DctP family solute receptor
MKGSMKVAALALAFAGSLAGPSFAQQVELTIGHTLNPDSHYHAAATKFKEVVEQKSNGQIKVTIFPQGQLGGEVKMLQSARTGAIGLVVTASAPLENTVPEAAILSLPYLFNSLDESDRVLQSEVGQHFLNYLPARGLLGLGFLSSIERNVYTTKKPVKAKADMAGLKLRVIQSPAYVEGYQAFGTQPTPMAYSEVYLAMQNGVVDGAENSPDTMIMDRFVEVSKYYNMTKVHYMPSLLVMSKVRFDALNKDQQKIVHDAAKEAVPAAIAAYRRTYDESMQKIKQANVEIISTDTAELAQTARAMWPKLINQTPDGEKNLKIIEAAKAKTN